MIKKLSKYGNSHAIIIDKPILKLLRIDETTTLELTTDGQSLLIKPVIANKVFPHISKDKKKQKAFINVVQKYDKVLNKLAKN